MHTDWLSLSERTMARCRRDPLFFCRHVLGGEQPWERQAQILLALRDAPRVAVRSGHGVGKTWTAARAALWFLYSHPRAIVLTTAPTQRQVRSILWTEIRRQVRTAVLPLGGKLTETALVVDDGWFALGLSTDEPERFQGYHAEHLLLVMDEAPGVPEDIYEAARGVLTSRHARVLLIGNPTQPRGPFYEAFRSPHWQAVHIPCTACPNVTTGRVIYPKLVTAEWVETQAREWGRSSPAFRSRVLGEFPEESEHLLTPLAWLHAARERGMAGGGATTTETTETAEPQRTQRTQRTARKEEGTAARTSMTSLTSMTSTKRTATNERQRMAGEGPPHGGRASAGPAYGGNVAGALRMGVDVARYGSDRTVLALADGAALRELHSATGLSTMETAGRIIALARARGVRPERVAVDDTGVGGGVTDRLRELGWHVTAVQAAGRAQGNFANRRAELFWALREALDPAGPQPLALAVEECGGVGVWGRGGNGNDNGNGKNGEALIQELSAIHYGFNSRGEIQVEGKDAIRARLGRSPDLADAVSLVMALPAKSAPPRVWEV